MFNKALTPRRFLNLACALNFPVFFFYPQKVELEVAILHCSIVLIVASASCTFCLFRLFERLLSIDCYLTFFVSVYHGTNTQLFMATYLRLLLFDRDRALSKNHSVNDVKISFPSTNGMSSDYITSTCSTLQEL